MVGTVLDYVKDETERFYATVGELAVTPKVEPEEIREHLRSRYDFGEPVPVAELIADVSGMLRRWSTHVTHPRYFGLFNPSIRPISVGADALAAAYNPQLAVWPHAPAAQEIERWVLRFFLSRIGFEPEAAFANFTSGGQEANLTAVVAALVHQFPTIEEGGIRALNGQPALYLSNEGHHSFHKSASCTGLGRAAVRVVETAADLRMDVGALSVAVERDRNDGLLPFMVVGTAGATGSGVIDPLSELAEFAKKEELWLHVDAAWGATALLSQKLRSHLQGIHRADSVTWDAHKWLSVPVGAGMFFCRHAEPLSRAFGVSASYVPPGQKGTVDPYAMTIQWSRRFIGLKVFMALAELGADGYEELIDRQAEMGELLRDRLRSIGCEIVNDTPLPLVCFTHDRIEGGGRSTAEVVEQVNSSGRAWVSDVELPRRGRVLRACISSFRTDPGDIEILVEELEKAFASAGTRAADQSSGSSSVSARQTASRSSNVANK